jgi:hypothetical protein
MLNFSCNTQHCPNFCWIFSLLSTIFLLWELFIIILALRDETGTNSCDSIWKSLFSVHFIIFENNWEVVGIFSLWISYFLLISRSYRCLVYVESFFLFLCV